MNRILALVVCFASITASAQTPEVLFSTARQAMRAGDHEKAVDLLEKAVAARPSSAPYHYWLGSAYGNVASRGGNMLKQGSLARKARIALERAVELDPKFIDARMALVEFYLLAPGFMGGGEDKAMKQVAEIRKLDSLSGHRALARVYLRQKKVELARSEMVAAVREQPNSAKAHYAYGAFLMNEKNYKDALASMETALRLDPEHMMASFRVGQLAVLAENNYTRGEELLKKYLARTPGDEDAAHSRAWFWLGRIYELQGRKAEAKQSYQTSLRLAPAAKDVAEALKRVS